MLRIIKVHYKIIINASRRWQLKNEREIANGLSPLTINPFHYDEPSSSSASLPNHLKMNYNTFVVPAKLHLTRSNANKILQCSYLNRGTNLTLRTRRFFRSKDITIPSLRSSELGDTFYGEIKENHVYLISI